MSGRKLITIITPNLNGGSYLRECLDSVAGQGGVDYEHLVMDGGSHDNSEEIVKGFAGVNWNQEPDKGMSDAINKGFAKAKGAWVMWLNSDDRLKPDALKSLMQFATKHADADVIYGDFEFIGKESEVIRRLHLPGWSRFISVHHCCYVPSTACMLRKSSVIDEGFKLREDFHYVMDGEYYARLDRAGKKFLHLRECLAQFRIHGENASMRHLGRKEEMEDIMKAERQHVESRAIRRAYGITLFEDPYLNGLVDGVLWIIAGAWKVLRKGMGV